MKRLIYLLALSTIVLACKNESKDYVSLSGKITNKNSDSVTILGIQNKYRKVLKLKEDGSFTDTLKVNPGIYRLFDGKQFASLYLKNGSDIKVSIDAKKFNETITFTGTGISESKFLAKSAIKQIAFFKDFNTLLTLSKEEYDAKMNPFVEEFIRDLNASSTDSAFITVQKRDVEMMQKQLGKMRQEKAYIAQKLAKGIASPIFENYENFKGGTTSLSDLKGKYVYIDLWATWCNPCKQEIPFLKEIEKKFHGKNIEFVSISIDQQKNNDAWKKMVADKHLTGTQLIADSDWSSKFVKDYMVSGIPRFILIDTEGNIVDADAPRPSDPKLIELFNTLSI